MSTVVKRAVVEGLRDSYSASEMVFFIDFKNVPVAAERRLRVDLRSKSATLKVAKARLIKIALRDLGVVEKAPQLEQLITGQIGVIFAKKDSQLVAKSLISFQRDSGKDVFVTGGLYNESLFDVSRIVDLSKLPAKQVLLQRLAFVLSFPVTSVARVIKVVAESKSN